MRNVCSPNESTDAFREGRVVRRPGLKIQAADRRSVDFSLPARRQLRSKPRRHPERELTVLRKQCSTCRLFYRTRTPAEMLMVFSRDNTNKTDGLQPQCKACRAAWESGGIFSRTRALIHKESLVTPDVLKEWESRPGGLSGELERIWKTCRGECYWCGGDPRTWANGGHCLDRVDNKKPHYPWNVRIACWPCNASRGSKNHDAFAIEAKGRLIAFAIDPGRPETGRGRVQWDLIDERWRRKPPVDLSAFIDPDQTCVRLDSDLPLFACMRLDAKGGV